MTAPDAVDVEYFRQRQGIEIPRVGRVESGEGVWLERPDGSVTRLERGGFDHLREPGG